MAKSLKEIMSELDELTKEDEEEKVVPKPSPVPQIDPKKIESLEKTVGSMAETLFGLTPQGQIFSAMKAKYPSITPDAANEIAQEYMKIQGEKGGSANPGKSEPTVSSDEREIMKIFGISEKDYLESKSLGERDEVEIGLDGRLSRV